MYAEVESKWSAGRVGERAMTDDIRRPEEGWRVEKEGGGGRRKRSDNPSKLTPTSAPGEMQIWSICHVCLGILILVRGRGFSLAALWLLSDPPAFLSPSFPRQSRRLPGTARGERRIACELAVARGFGMLQLSRPSSFRFLRSSRKEVDKNGVASDTPKNRRQKLFRLYITLISPEPVRLVFYFVTLSLFRTLPSYLG